MVDLKSQYQHIKTEIDQAIQSVIDSALFINGPSVGEFKKDLETYLQIKNVIPCANGTDALQLALMALDLKEGDEIITASFTYAATAEVIALLKLTPVLVEVDKDTFCINSDKIEAAITPKTKAIIPVHLFGQCADMEKIILLAKKYNLFVIEDTAQAIGADYTFQNGEKLKAGTIGTIGCTSFFPSKNLGSFGDGGAVFTNDNLLAGKIKRISNHGQSSKYVHDEIGINSRLDTLQAAILKVKLKYLDLYAANRNIVADYYDETFQNHPDIIIPKRVQNSSHVFHQYTLQILNGKRDELKKYLAEKNIPTMVYYPKAIHQQKAFKNKDSEKIDFSITENLCQNVLSLPIHTEMETEQLGYICSKILAFFAPKL